MGARDRMRIPRRLKGKPRSAVLRLSPGAGLFLRGEEGVQFGLDATRAGIIPTDRPVGLAVALAPARCGTTREELTDRLELAGFAPPAADNIVDDLLSFGILSTSSSLGRVAVLGETVLADELSRLLTANGFRVRRLDDSGAPEEQIASLPASTFPVLVDQWANAHAIAPVLTRYFPHSLAVAGFDARGIVGPLRINGEGPCPVCIDLYRSEIDPYWTFTATQTALPWVASDPQRPQSGSRVTAMMGPDPAVRAATAGVAIAAVCSALGIAPPAGENQLPNRALGNLAGTITEINLYSSTHDWRRQRALPTHRHCPICHPESRDMKRRKRTSRAAQAARRAITRLVDAKCEPQA